MSKAIKSVLTGRRQVDTAFIGQVQVLGELVALESTCRSNVQVFLERLFIYQ